MTEGANYIYISELCSFFYLKILITALGIHAIKLNKLNLLASQL